MFIVYLGSWRRVDSLESLRTSEMMVKGDVALFL